MTRPVHPVTRRRRHAGVTLIELMIGLALGMVLVSALLLLFANASTSGHNLARAGAQIENGRYVSELMREELQLAGFYGELSIRGAVYAPIDPCSLLAAGWSATPLTLPTPVTGYAASDVVGCLDERKAGTQAIAIRRLGSQAVAPASLPGGNVQSHVQYSYCADDAPPLLIAGIDPVGFTLRNRACSSVNPVRPVVSRIYYIARCRRCSDASDANPTLKRVDLVAGQLITTSIADGVDDMRFEYGFDLDGNGSPDVYLPAAGAAGPSALWSNVMAVKLHFITRSGDKVQGRALAAEQTFQLGGLGAVTTPNDGYARNVYSSLVRLVNPSGALETQ